MEELLTAIERANDPASAPTTRDAILAAYPMARLGLECLNEGIRKAVEDDRRRLENSLATSE